MRIYIVHAYADKENLKESRYFLKCSYLELTQRSLTTRIYYIIKKRKKCTTREIYLALKKEGIDIHRNTVLSYLNTMAYYDILTKEIMGANIAYWSLGKNRIALEELQREIDIKRLKEYPADLLFFSGNIHIYGIAKHFTKYIQEMEERDPNISLIKTRWEKIKELYKEITLITDMLRKTATWVAAGSIFQNATKKLSSLEKIVYLLYLINKVFQMHYISKNVEWIKESKNKVYVKCDFRLAKFVREQLLNIEGLSMSEEEIINQLDGYRLNKSITNQLDEVVLLIAALILPLNIILHFDPYGLSLSQIENEFKKIDKNLLERLKSEVKYQKNLVEVAKGKRDVLKFAETVIGLML